MSRKVQFSSLWGAQMLRVKFLVFVAVLGFTNPAFASRVALVVGNSDYQNTEHLKNPKNDALQISNALRALDFEVVQVIDASQKEFGEALLTFEEKLDGATHALFFYAGHGMQLRGENYLLSIDAKVRNQHLLDSEAIRLSQVLGIMEDQAQTSIAFIDACRDNPLANALRDRLPNQARSLGLGRGLALVGGSYSDSLVAFATTPGKIAYDGNGQNSPFTEALLEHIDAPGIEVSTMLKRVSSDVLTKTEGKQRPEVVSQMSREFYFKVSIGTTNKQPSALDKERLATQQLNLAVGIRDQKARLEAIEGVARAFPETSAASIARQLTNDVKPKVPAGGAQSPSQSEESDVQSTNVEVAKKQPASETRQPDTTIRFLEQEQALGLSRSSYRSMQLALNGSGFSSGAVDGLFGPRSRSALRRFEAANGLSQTGYLSKETYSMLLALVPKSDDRDSEPEATNSPSAATSLDGSYEVVVRRRWDDEYAKYNHDPYYSPGRQEVLAVFRFSRSGSNELALTYQRDFTGNTSGIPKVKATLDQAGNFKFKATLSSHFGTPTIRQVTFSRRLVSFRSGQSARFEPGRFDQQFIKMLN